MEALLNQSNPGLNVACSFCAQQFVFCPDVCLFGINNEGTCQGERGQRLGNVGGDARGNAKDNARDHTRFNGEQGVGR